MEKFKKALTIFCDINSDRWTDDEKAIAIHMIANEAENLNSTTRKMMIEVIKYLWNQLYYLTEDDKNAKM